MIAIPQFVRLAFIEGKPVGILIPLPNINEILIRMNGRLLPFGIFKLLFGMKKTKLLRVAIMGIHRKYKNKGIDAIFTYEIFIDGVEYGFEGGELSWILEDNYVMRNMLESWGTKHYITYRIYGKEL